MKVEIATADEDILEFDTRRDERDLMHELNSPSSMFLDFKTQYGDEVILINKMQIVSVLCKKQEGGE